MKILLVAPNESSFIKKDFENLSSSFPTDFATCWSPTEIFSTLKRVKSYDLCFFWFASIRFLPVFLLAKLMGKKTVVVAGGYDVSHIPEINYGGVKPWSIVSFMRKIILNYADKVVTVSNSNTNEAIQNAKVPTHKVERIYLGFHSPKAQLRPWAERKNQVVFIAGCDSVSYKIKGFETFLTLAQNMPHVTFIHIGPIQIKEFERECSKWPNIKNLGFIENMCEAFSEILNDSKVLFLPSKIESFGVCVLEGGLHGCVPVTSNCYALPEVIGEIGQMFEPNDIENFQHAINSILSREHNPEEIQKYYVEKFNAEERRDRLLNLLKSIP